MQHNLKVEVETLVKMKGCDNGVTLEICMKNYMIIPHLAWLYHSNN